MLSKTKPSTFNQSDLTSSLSSIARKQNLLAAVPPALRLLPLVAFAAGDIYERRYGRNPLDGLAGPTKRDQIETKHPLTAPGCIGSPASGFSDGPAKWCGICLRRGLLDGFRRDASMAGSPLRWCRYRFGFYDNDAGEVCDRWVRMTHMNSLRAIHRPRREIAKGGLD